MTRLLALTTLAVAACFLLPAGWAQDREKGKDTQLTDEQFVMKVSADNLAEIRLGKLATERAGSDRVKEFGRQMVEDHTQANKDLRMLADRTRLSVSQQPPKECQQTIDRLSKLEGAEFDRAYMQEMLQNHQKAVSMFEAKSDNVTNPELKQYVNKTLPKLRGHLQMARKIAGKSGEDRNRNP